MNVTMDFTRSIAKVRHDLRNPLSHILGFTDMLIEEMQSGDTAHLRRDLETINVLANDMIVRINRYLDGQETQGSDLSSLQAQIEIACANILAASERLACTSSVLTGTGFNDDLNRIAGSTRQLLDVAKTALEPLIRQTGPLARPDSGFETTRHAQTDFFAHKEGKILVVDDSEENREILRRRLSRMGYVVSLQEDGRRALDFISSHDVDLVLLDIFMPELDGFQTLQQLKADPSRKHLPVIMLSSADEVGNAVRCIELGADDFLPKPFNPVLLMARIESSLSKKKLRDQEQDFLKRLQDEQEKSERLLLNILPRAIAERLKKGEGIIADSFPEATVLFADFVGFTRFSAGVPAKTLVASLNEIFSRFDSLCEQHGVEKIKMIGDGYMVVGGLPTPRPDHAEAIARLALAMQKAVSEFTAGRDKPFRMRIGINTGPVVAGVIGTRKFAYDLWGDTVNLASRMESHAPTDGILLAEASYLALKDKYAFDPKQLLRVKGKGEISAYLLRGESPISD